MKNRISLRIIALALACVMSLVCFGCAGTPAATEAESSAPAQESEKTYRVAYVADSGLDEY